MNLPSGTITFLFTDIEGSTKLWEADPDSMRVALAHHDALMRRAIEAHDGYVFKTLGDAFCAAFHTAPDALHAALSAQQALLSASWPEAARLKVRMALHTGAVENREGDYFGQPLSRVARLLAAGYGGQILLSQVACDLVCDTLPLPAALQDLGEHRLQDLARPEHIFQLNHPDLPHEFAPLKSLDNVTMPNNLPQQVTSFIGREKELAAVQKALTGARLLTLTGAGGSGKSRLALQVAADLLEIYPEGVWLAELAPLADPLLVEQTVANVLGVKEEAGKPLLTTLVENLQTRGLLLLLDNCEHLLDVSARLADSLLRSCPGVQILATSREGLGIAGETTYRVPSLSLPDLRQTPTPESLSQFEAVQLFIARAVQTQPSFVLTLQNAPALASICHRLDGIPLALELAAARARSLSMEDINSKLDQRFRLLTGGSRTALPRQQTLRSLIDWSYDLLSQAEKVLLCRLSVFAGGWTLEAAEAVCAGGEVEEWETLDFLTSLYDKSLILAEPFGVSMRYRMLETVRQYARDRMLEGGEGQEFRDKHLAFFVAFAEKTEAQIDSLPLKEVLNRFEGELDNLRAALDWSGDSPERAESGLRLALAAGAFLSRRGYLNEIWERLSRAVEASGRVNPSLRARGLTRLGHYANVRLDLVTARRMLEESLQIRQELNDRRGIAETLNALGTTATYQKDLALARRRYEESLAIQREIGNRNGIAAALNNLGATLYYQGDLEAARPFYVESLQLKRHLGDPFGIYISLLNVGELNLTLKDYHAAGRMWRECLSIVIEHQLTPSIPWVFKALGGLFAVTDTPLNAARLWGVMDRLLEETNGTLPVQDREQLDRQIAAARAALNNDAAFDAAWQEGRNMPLDQAVALVQQETNPTMSVLE